MTEHLLKALTELLGAPQQGTVAYTRCLSDGEIDLLLKRTSGQMDGWQVAGVGARAQASWISGDKAVEIREDKGQASCLLVLPSEAGAGMDGIYNAAREISESDLFTRAVHHARRGLHSDTAAFGAEAIKRAQRVGSKRRKITGRQQLAFYGSLATQEEPGAALPVLGLWPVAGSADEAAQRLAHSSVMVDRLFQPGSAAQTPGMRVASLSLGQERADDAKGLEESLRRCAGMPLEESIREVSADKSLWLGNLRPAFLEGKLERLDLVSWRSAGTGKLQKWSGLTLTCSEGEEDSLPQFRINEDCMLTVKWKVSPETLPPGAATYEVQMLVGEEMLASETVVHRGKAELKVVFDKDHFEEVEEGTRQEVRIRISTPGVEGIDPLETEDFLLCHGEGEVSERTSSGEVFRCVAEGMVQAESSEAVEAFLEERQKGKQGMPDKKAKPKPGEAKAGQMLAFRPVDTKRGFRVERPGLLREIEEDWSRRDPNCVGRWRIRCRPDGNRAGDLEFVRCGVADESERLMEATRKFREDCLKSGGVMSRLYLHGHTSAVPAQNYLNAWTAALENGPPSLALACTLEVTTMSGKPLGLVVLPHHPLRVAWQCGFDALALHLSLEEKLKAQRVRKNLAWLDGANVPFLLPGLSEGWSFVFADTLGFAGVLMVPENDPEPKATAALMTVCYAGDSTRLSPSLSLGAGDAIAREISHYLDTHPHCSVLNVHALRPGDGATVVKAIGKALATPWDENSSAEPDQKYRPVAVRLDIHPSEEQLPVAGRYLARLTERRRKRAAAPQDEDAWCLESIPLPGNRSVPRLRWARRAPGALKDPAHLSLAFDIHRSGIQASESADGKVPLLAYGLVSHLVRDFCFENGQPRWRLSLSAEHDGLKLPDRVITERLLNLQQSILRQTAANAGFPNGWPELYTSPQVADVELLGKLHDLSDWVVTMDRNAGIEFYDSPRESESVFDAYVIDAVPERDDLGCHQVITSTKKFEEVRGLLHHTLAALGLSGSARNCEVLLGHLKGLSGRLAMRLAAGAREADPTRISAELVALALVRAKCHAAMPDDANWNPLAQGFFVPLDDVRDLVPEKDEASEKEAPEESRRRADLLYVGIPKRGRLSFTFIEVKYRRYLSQARSTQLYERIEEQTAANRDRWEAAFFSQRSSVIEKNLQGARLGRVLRFYAEKARRHHLSESVYNRALDELTLMLRNPADYQPAALACAGYIFCPDFPANQPESQPWDGECTIRMFGPDSLPDQTSAALTAPAPPPQTTKAEPETGAEPKSQVEVEAGTETQQGAGTSGAESAPVLPPDTPAWDGVRLGDAPSGDPVHWKTAINTNPHLMIVGLPGMGKTHSLINICAQLQRQGISPIVFSYHDDIDENLAAAVPKVVMHDCLALGFNPMTIAQSNAVAHVESAGQLRDIFHAVFPDLGELQREKLREAIKRGYEECGWVNGNAGTIPDFRRFLLLLRASAHTDKSTQTLLARLNELDDFNFFSPPGESKSLLDESASQLIRIHSVANEAMQRASAGFVLYRIYQDMFRRGRASKLTHAIVFDEAHRAGKLKLLPTFAKECRKYGLALIVASQEAKDFDPGLFAATGSYLVLRVTDQDAKVMAKNAAGSDQERALADRLKTMPKYEAMFFSESLRRPLRIRLSAKFG
jgi:DNA phosphorothioation-dependent restriction protein DptH